MEEILSKEESRSQIKSLISALTTSEKNTYSDSVSEQLIHLNPNYLLSPICSFQATENEVDLTQFHEFLIDKGHLLYMPKFLEDVNGYVFCRVTDLNSLIPGKFGILEPEQNNTCISLNEAKEFISTWMVPGLAFDQNGHRLGRGMGWYDRFLVHCKGVKVGIMFGCQLQKQSFVSDKHDIAMNYLVTESNFYTIL